MVLTSQASLLSDASSMCSTVSTIVGGFCESSSSCVEQTKHARQLLEALQKATGTWIPYSVDAHAGKYWLMCMQTRHDVPWIGTLKLHCGAPQRVWPFRVPLAPHQQQHHHHEAQSIYGCFCILKTARDHATLMKRMKSSGLVLAARLKKGFTEENALFVYLRDRRMLLQTHDESPCTSSYMAHGVCVARTMTTTTAETLPSSPLAPSLLPVASSGKVEEELRHKLREREEHLGKVQAALHASEQKYQALMKRLRDPASQSMTLQEFNRSSTSSMNGSSAAKVEHGPSPSARKVPAAAPAPTPKFMGGLYSQSRGAYLDAEEAALAACRGQKRVLLMDWKH